MVTEHLNFIRIWSFKNSLKFHEKSLAEIKYIVNGTKIILNNIYGTGIGHSYQSTSEIARG